MERIMYRKTLDVHKNGIQFLLQGFETADNLSRVIEISLMASGDAIDFPLEKIEALMYVKTPNATEPNINKCTIKDNKVVYEVLPIVEEGITNMQLKLIETGIEGAKSVLASPKFAVEVTKSDADDSGAEQTTTFTALENAMAKAKSVYDERFLRMELTSDCIFRAYYADGTVYETDLLKRLFHEGNSLLSESFAHGSTGIRAGEDTDNSMYYSNVSKSEALNAKNIMENSEKLLEEVKLHGVYTAFGIDFESGEVEYVSPSFKFKIDLESGELDVIGQNYTFDNEVGRIVDEWLLANNVVLKDLQAISTTHADEIKELISTTDTHTDEIEKAQKDIETLEKRVTPIELGGTGGKTELESIKNLKILLSKTKTTLGLSDTATPDDAFNALFNQIALTNIGNLVIQKITSSCIWTAPKAASQMFRVFCVGGGGGGGFSHNDRNAIASLGAGGGGGGYIEVLDVKIEANTDIDVVCGAGGVQGCDGGETSFGDLLSAGGGKKGGDATDSICGNGGNGGAGGGGGGYYGRATYAITAGSGGNGVLGGGGGGAAVEATTSGYANNYLKSYGNGGISEYGGNGGTISQEPVDGQLFNGTFLSCLFRENTIGASGSKGQNYTDSIYGEQTFHGYGGSGGNGGLGGNGGIYGSSGGGGGYCGNGGNGSTTNKYSGGGGGGGYCGNGGDGGFSGGGGGGFFSNGGGTGGGGFFSDGKFDSGGNGGVLIMYVKEEE